MRADANLGRSISSVLLYRCRSCPSSCHIQLPLPLLLCHLSFSCPAGVRLQAKSKLFYRLRLSGDSLYHQMVVQYSTNQKHQHPFFHSLTDFVWEFEE
jgi:hypothetical protein